MNKIHASLKNYKFIHDDVTGCYTAVLIMMDNDGPLSLVQTLTLIEIAISVWLYMAEIPENGMKK